MEGPHAAASATPILDRVELLPPELRDRSWIVGLLVGGIGALGGLILALDRPAFVTSGSHRARGSRSCSSARPCPSA